MLFNLYVRLLFPYLVVVHNVEVGIVKGRNKIYNDVDQEHEIHYRVKNEGIPTEVLLERHCVGCIDTSHNDQPKFIEQSY